jgi:hypothetical protein
MDFYDVEKMRKWFYSEGLIYPGDLLALKGVVPKPKDSNSGWELSYPNYLWKVSPSVEDSD